MIIEVCTTNTGLKRDNCTTRWFGLTRSVGVASGVCRGVDVPIHEASCVPRPYSLDASFRIIPSVVNGVLELHLELQGPEVVPYSPVLLLIPRHKVAHRSFSIALKLIVQ